MGTTTPEQQKIMGVVVYLFPALSLAFTSFLPAALTLQFCMTSALSFCQTYVLSSNKARVFLGIYPINRQEPAATGVYEGTITRHPIDATINQPTKLSALASYKKTAQDWMKKRSGEQGKRLNKTERRKADAYEQRRRQELEEEIYHRRQKLLKQEKQKDV